MVELNELIVELSNVVAQVVVDDWVAIAPPRAPTVCATAVVEIVLTIRDMEGLAVKFSIFGAEAIAQGLYWARTRNFSKT